jgi:uncharacterized protein (TIGR02466 family)
MSERILIDKLRPQAAKVQPLGLFETPLAYGNLTDGDALISELERLIRQRKDQSPGLARSNIGGWHSDTDMLEWGGQPAQKLAQTAINIAKRMSHFQDSSVADREWLVRMWANVTPAGGLNHLHSHPGNLWAAVLYIDMGYETEQESSNAGGSFYLEDPRFPMAAMRDTAFRMRGADGEPQQYQTEIELQRGNLIVFPAWLRHGVRPYTGKRERTSVAMNIDAVRKDVVR